MNFTDQQKSWILLVCIVLASGGTVVVGSYTGGCKLWCSILLGLAAGAGHVATALMSPDKLKGQDLPATPPQPQPPKP